MKELTSSVYTFSDLIQGNFLYVDKTEYLWKLIQPYKGMYFLSRPQRFGKSLTVSTLDAIFEGCRELFKGLALYDKPYDWKREYFRKYRQVGRRIILIGANFNPDTRQVDDWKMEAVGE